MEKFPINDPGTSVCNRPTIYIQNQEPNPTGNIHWHSILRDGYGTCALCFIK